MRLLIVVQRYGAEVFGGAEQHARAFARRLTSRGHEVEVLTSRALGYTDWADHFPDGDDLVDGILVHRLGVGRPRDPRLFDGLSARLSAFGNRVAPAIEEEWMRLQGPWLPALPPWLEEHSGGYDAVVFFTYLYWTTWAGLSAVRVPSILHPTAHDEPPIYRAIFDRLFRLPSGFAFSTAEEAAFVRARFEVRQPSRVIGIGIESSGQADPEAFRRRFDLGGRPYLVCVGRTDPGKGSVELFEFFSAYKRRRPGPLALVLVGEEVYPLPHHDDVIKTGFSDDVTRESAVAGAEVLVQPSFFESFSMVLAEGWASERPALVQGRCDVLVGQARRSGGGIPYCGYAEFETALDMLLADATLRRRLGASGRGFVERNYTWDVVMTRYESFIDRMIGGRPTPERQPAW